MSWESTMHVAIQNCLEECGFVTLSEVSTEEGEENDRWVDFPSNFPKFLNVDTSIPITSDQKTSLDSPSYEHMTVSVATEEEEKVKEMHLPPVHQLAEIC
jgi:hypothetical protein